MVKIIVLLLLFGLTIVRSMQLDQVDIMAKKEIYDKMDVDTLDVDFSLEEFYRIMEFRPLAVEFMQHFENISLADLDLPSTRLPSQQDLQCLADMTQLMKSLSSKSLWALRMFDSWGKIPSGILSGNIIDMGNYDECIGINKAIANNHRIKGKYCFAKSPSFKVLVPINIKIAVCLPSSCSANHMDTFLKQLLQKLININVTEKLINEDSCKTAEREPLDGLTIFTIVLLSVLGVALTLATVCDYFLYDDQKQLPILVKAFSIRANSRTLFRLVEPRSNPNVIDCLHGIRCISLIWVLFGHQYIMNFIVPTMNAISFIRWLKQPFSNLVFHGAFSVDSFFFISGLLLVMVALRSLEKTKGKLNIPMMYLHRYLRLTPLVALAILVYMTILPLMTDGPLSDDIGFDNYSVCERTWFYTLLYVQNYATKELCINHSWYLAVDMQLYFISPILLIALYKWGKKAAAGIFVLMLLLSACLFSTIMTNKYNITSEYGAMAPQNQRRLYFATHTHAAPWLIGVLFGYFMHVNRNKSFNLSRVVIWLGWLLCLALIFTSIFATYPNAQFDTPAMTLLENAFYYTLSRIAWPLSLCWLVFACKHGYGGLANSFLSTPLWQPLSKLSYSAYIFHLFFQQINAKRVRSSIHYSDYDVMLSFWASFGFTLILSYIMYIMMEAPFGVIESMLLPRQRSSPKPVVAEQSQLEANPDINKAYTIPQLETNPEKDTGNSTLSNNQL